ncbi:MAG: pyridoxal phosphate-dependent aminotransferase [Candidatus Polarisedimenticolia bacterium]
MFSSRLPWDRPTNRLTRLLNAKRATGVPLLDLTESNPTRVAIPYPTGAIAAALAAAAAAPYEPEPFGLPPARAAVAAHWRRAGRLAAADRIVLTASTSEAYALLFKLLADPGDAVLVPRPGYPLFDHLAALEGVRTVPYGLALERRFRIDRDALERAAEGGGGPRPPRALVLVNPGNPTGTGLDPGERSWLLEFCAARRLPIIADEVFIDYPFAGQGGSLVSLLPAAGEPEARTVSPGTVVFVLGGLSKSCGLPHLKLGWIAATGPDPLVGGALSRLELIADTYLSAGTPVQQAAARLLEVGEGIRGRIRARVSGNRDLLVRAVGPDSSCRVLPADGGWSAVLRVPAVRTEEEMVIGLLDRDGVLVHPGYFFDFPGEAFLVLSLLPDPAIFEEGVRRLLAAVA